MSKEGYLENNKHKQRQSRNHSNLGHKCICIGTTALVSMWWEKIYIDPHWIQLIFIF
jgi:hypothetical protein